MDLKYLYPQMGHLHTAGVDFVIHRLPVSGMDPFTKVNIMNHTAEFMYLVSCCGETTDPNPPPGAFNKIRVVDYADFLYELHSQLKSKRFGEWLTEANVSAETTALLNLIMTDNDEAVSNTIDIDSYPPYYLVETLAKRIARTDSSVRERQAIGVITSVAKESMTYARSLESDKNKAGTLRSLVKRYVDLEAESISESQMAVSPANAQSAKKGFRWSWRADVEGTLAGLISGAVSAIPGGFLGTAIGGALGALGGGISNSVIRSLPAFR